MKLIKFDPTEFRVSHAGKIFVRFSRNGYVSLGKKTRAKLNLKEGTKILIAQGDDDPENWFIVPGEGAELSGTKCGALRLRSRAVANMVIDFLEIKTDSVSFLIDPKPVDMDGQKVYRILINDPLYTEKEGGEGE